MKKALLLTVLVLLVLAFSGTALANERTTHMSDVTGRTCFLCHAAHQGSNRMLLASTINGVQVQGFLEGYTPTTTGNSTEDHSNQNVSNICLACHDGTGTELDVSNVSPGADHIWHAGVFDFSTWPAAAGSGVSAHTVALNTNSKRLISGAPGNSNRAHFAEGRHGTGRTSYRRYLSCTSCHNPHGNSERQHALLHLNPNESVYGTFNAGADGLGWDGKQFRTVTLNRIGSGLYEMAGGGHWLRQYVSAGTIRYPVAVDIGGTWVMNRAFAGGNWNTVNFQVSSTDAQVRFTGATADPGTATLTARVFLPIFVEVADTLETTIFDEFGNPVSIPVRVYRPTQHADGVVNRESVGLNRWCMGCHEMYNNPQSTTRVAYPDGSHYFAHIRNLTPLANYGVPFTQRGATAESNCLSCHFAHGTNNDLMLDANKRLIGSRDVVDPNPANKRYMGGSLCIRCHQGFSNRNISNYEFYLRNTDTFWDTFEREPGFNVNNDKWQ